MNLSNDIIPDLQPSFISVLQNDKDRHKVSHEMVVFPPQPLDELKRSMTTCQICFMIVNDPQECKKCQNQFCKDCIQEWIYAQKRKHSQKMCPFRCNTKEFKPSHKFVKEVLSEYKVRCLNHILGCEDLLAIANLKNHLNTECMFDQVYCDKRPKCKEIMMRKDMIDHIKICQYVQEKCQYCHTIWIERRLMQNHHLFECKGNLHPCSYQYLKQQVEKYKNKSKLRKKTIKLQESDLKIMDDCQSCKDKIAQKQLKQAQNVTQMLRSAFINIGKMTLQIYTNSTSQNQMPSNSLVKSRNAYLQSIFLKSFDNLLSITYECKLKKSKIYNKYFKQRLNGQDRKQLEWEKEKEQQAHQNGWLYLGDLFADEEEQKQQQEQVNQSIQQNNQRVQQQQNHANQEENQNISDYEENPIENLLWFDDY
eukprot:403355753